MKTTITQSQFINEFQQVQNNRDSQNFSYEGLKALYNYFEELEEDCGIEIEFDPIAICCEYAEYDSLEELQEDYQDITSVDALRDNTQVIEFNHGSIIIQQY